MSSLDSLDHPNHQDDFLEDSPDSSEFENQYPPFLNISPKKNQTKLAKLLKAAELGTSVDPYSKSPDRRLKFNEIPHGFASCFSEESLRVDSQDSLEGEEYIVDPIPEKGLLNYMRNMKQVIRNFALIEKKQKGMFYFALIKSKRRMRRKSDCSKWGGGHSRFEQTSSFLMYNYTPALAMQEGTSKKEALTPLYLKTQVEARSSSRQREMSAHSGRKFSNPDDSGNSNIILLTSNSSPKMFHVKDAVLMNLEDELVNDEAKEKIDAIRQMLKSIVSGNESISTSRIVIINKDLLRDVPESYKNNQRNHQENDELKMAFRTGGDLQNLKINTNIELKIPTKKKRIRAKIRSVLIINQIRNKSLTDKIDGPSPISRVNTMQPKSSSKNLPPLHSKHPSISISRNNDIKDFKEELKAGEMNGNQKHQIQTSSQKKLAELVNPHHRSKKENGNKSLNSTGYLKQLSPNSTLKSPNSTNKLSTQSVLVGGSEKHKSSKFKIEKEIVAAPKIYSQKASPKAVSKETSGRFLTQESHHSKTKSCVQSPTQMRKGPVGHLKPFAQKSPLFPLISPKKKLYSNKLGSKKVSIAS